MRKLKFTTRAKKSVTKLLKYSPEISRLIASQIKKLRENPMANNTKKIVGFPCYRARVGSYRIVYEFNDEYLFITLVEKRDEVYQKLNKLYSKNLRPS